MTIKFLAPTLIMLASTPAAAAVLVPGSSYDFIVARTTDTGDIYADHFAANVGTNGTYQGALVGDLELTQSEIDHGGGRYTIQVELLSDLDDLFAANSGYSDQNGDYCSPDDGDPACLPFSHDGAALFGLGTGNALDLSQPFALTSAVLTYSGRDGFSESKELIGEVSGANPWNGSFPGANLLGGFTDAFGQRVYDIRLTLEGTVIAGVVPEPSSWLMLVGGFGMVGGTIRRRHVVRGTRALPR